jgi:hypothetical protein
MSDIRKQNGPSGDGAPVRATPIIRAESVDISGPEDVHKLHKHAAGLFGVLFLTVTGSAPISATLFNTPIAVGFGNGIGAPALRLLQVTLVISRDHLGLVRAVRAALADGAWARPLPPRTPQSPDGSRWWPATVSVPGRPARGLSSGCEPILLPARVAVLPESRLIPGFQRLVAMPDLVGDVRGCAHHRAVHNRGHRTRRGSGCPRALRCHLLCATYPCHDRQVQRNPLPSLAPGAGFP